MKFFLKCGETAEVCDKCQYNEASLWDSFRMKIHLLICKCCRTYSSTNNELTKSLKSANLKTLPPKKKDLLRAQLNQEIQANSKLKDY